MKYAILTLALTGCVSGCAGMSGASSDNRSPEQIKAAAADRSANASCTRITTPWGVTTVSSNASFDKGTSPNATVTINSDCSVGIGAGQKTTTTTVVTTPGQ